MHGMGSMTWPDGRFYKGGFVEDRKSGEGSLTWPDGRLWLQVFVKGRWVIGVVGEIIDTLIGGWGVDVEAWRVPGFWL